MIIGVLIRRPDPISHWKVAFFGGKKQKQCYSTEMMWYFPVLHRPCVGLTAAPPEEMQWFCPKCANKRKDKKHKKRKHRAHWRLGRGLKSCCHRGASCPDWAAGGIHPARVPRACQGCVSALSQGRGDALGRGLLGFTDCPSPGHWIWVHSDAVSCPCQRGICTELCEDFGGSRDRSRSCGSAATRMNVVNTDICPILSRFVINPSWTFAARCWEEEKM